MSFNADDIRDELLNLIAEKTPNLLHVHYTHNEAELTRLLDGIEFLILSRNEDWMDTAGLFVSEFSAQIAETELGRERLAEWLPKIGEAKHHNAYDDVADVCEALTSPGIPSGP